MESHKIHVPNHQPVLQMENQKIMFETNQSIVFFPATFDEPSIRNRMKSSPQQFPPSYQEAKK
jgi:hypothetical protein